MSIKNTMKCIKRCKQSKKIHIIFIYIHMSIVCKLTLESDDINIQRMGKELNFIWKWYF